MRAAIFENFVEYGDWYKLMCYMAVVLKTKNALQISFHVAK